MLGIHDYWLFMVSGVLLNLTPGQDTFYILGRSIAEGRKSGVASAFGIAVGSVFHTAMAALGLSAVLATSASAFTVMKLIGAAYLVYLGVRMLMTAKAVESPRVRHSGVLGAFRDGILTNAMNPKVALFFLALMPQFIAPDSHTKVAAFIALGLTFVATGTLWCLVLALSAARLRGFFLRHPRGWRTVSQAAGSLFILLGMRLAVSRQ
jgi:threonine/homoserine/homoserine lactone efflux protein